MPINRLLNSLFTVLGYYSIAVCILWLGVGGLPNDFAFEFYLVFSYPLLNFRPEPKGFVAGVDFEYDWPMLALDISCLLLPVVTLFYYDRGGALLIIAGMTVVYFLVGYGRAEKLYPAFCFSALLLLL